MEIKRPPEVNLPLLARLLAPPGPARAGCYERAGATVVVVPGRYCVTYLLVGPRSVTVVDVGSGRDIPAIERALDWIGWRGQAVETVMPTHLHFDHIMGINALARRRRSTVTLSRRGQAGIARDPPLRFPPHRDIHKIFPTYFIQGAPTVPLVDWRDGLDFGFPWAEYRFDVPLAAPLDDGDPLPGLPGWTVLAAPGHADDAVCLYHPEARFLVAGDTVRNFMGGGQGARFRGGEWNRLLCDPDDYAQTRARLTTLPVEVFFPGHGPVIEGTWGAIRDLPWYYP